MRRPRLVSGLCALVLLAAMACGGRPAEQSECGGDLTGFTHRTVASGDADLHYVTGGTGPAVVLLHGFPETWWTWRGVMTRLAATHTVIAPDLRGVGCSSATPGPYDAQTLAGDLDAVIRAAGVSEVAVVGHDTGGWVAYAYARTHRDRVSHLALSGTVIPGFGLDELLDFRVRGRGLPHLPFFMQPDVPEALITGREAEYLGRFVDSPAVKQSGALDLYIRSYSRPQRLTAALGQYRALYRDADDNRRGAGPLLTMPALAISGAGLTASTAASLSRVAAVVQDAEITGAGHYVQEERPDEFAAVLARFLR